MVFHSEVVQPTNLNLLLPMQLTVSDNNIVKRYSTTEFIIHTVNALEKIFYPMKTVDK